MKLFNFARLAIAICFVISGTYTNATVGTTGVTTQVCDSTLISYNNSSICDQSCRDSLKANYPYCFSGGATGEAASVTSISSTSFAQIFTLSNAISYRFFLPSGPRKSSDILEKGMSGGAENQRWNLWGNLSNNDTHQGYNSTDFSSTILTTVIGGDYTLSQNMLIGVSASFDNGDGSINGSGMNSSGFSIAPYFGIQFNPELALDVSLGFGSGKIDTSGTENKSDRLFGGANLSYNRWINNTQLTSKFSYLHGEESYDNSTNKLDQIRLGVQAGYWLENMMPYIGLAYSSDISRSTDQINALDNPIGKDALVWTLGINFFSLANGITGGITYNQEEGRTHQKNNTMIANIGVRF